jgi:hypothetical protein
MAFTYTVNKDKSVTILQDGTIFLEQIDDPTTPGWDTFETKAKAEEWAKEAIKRYQAEIDETKKASEAASTATDALGHVEASAESTGYLGDVDVVETVLEDTEKK